LSIAEGDDGGVVLRCFAGCDFASIATALGYQPSNLAPRNSGLASIPNAQRRPATRFASCVTIGGFADSTAASTSRAGTFATRNAVTR